MGFSWHSYHPNPETRRRDRRSGAASGRMREALEAGGRSPVAGPASARLHRQRARRARLAARKRPRARWSEAVVALALIVFVVVLVIATLEKLP